MRAMTCVRIREILKGKPQLRKNMTWVGRSEILTANLYLRAMTWVRICDILTENLSL